MKRERKQKQFKQIRFGKYYATYGMPCVTLEANYDHDDNLLPDGQWKTVAYLCSFRDYSWQVCGTYDGESDLGCTPVFGLDTMGSIVQRGRSNLGQESTVKYIIGCVAMDAVNNFMHSWWMDVDVLGPRHDWGWLSSNEAWTKFVERCYDKYVLNKKIEDEPLSEEEDQEEAI